MTLKNDQTVSRRTESRRTESRRTVSRRTVSRRTESGKIRNHFNFTFQRNFLNYPYDG